MTCLWNSLIKAIKDEDFKIYMKNPHPSPEQFVVFLKKSNKLCSDVSHNGKLLTIKEYKENLEAINNLNPRSIYRGYDCSSCDPVLLLVSHIFRIKIDHLYNGSLITYTPTSYRYGIKLHSSKTHMWA
jgi:hypothetical protein